MGTGEDTHMGASWVPLSTHWCTRIYVLFCFPFQPRDILQASFHKRFGATGQTLR